MTIAVFFDAQPHSAPWYGDGVIAPDGWQDHAPEFQKRVPFVFAFVPLSQQGELLVFGKFYHEIWSPYV
jgi:hypothetical protein